MIKPIKTELDYDYALDKIRHLFDIQESGKEWTEAEDDEFQILTTQVELYEDEHYKRKLPHPITAIQIRMAAIGWSQTDLAKCLGHKSRVSEIFKGKRKLNLQMIRKLHVALSLPLEVLVQEYEMPFLPIDGEKQEAA